jgi:hypothetical protein
MTENYPVTVLTPPHAGNPNSLPTKVNTEAGKPASVVLVDKNTKIELKQPHNLNKQGRSSGDIFGHQSQLKKIISLENVAKRRKGFFLSRLRHNFLGIGENWQIGNRSRNKV